MEQEELLAKMLSFIDLHEGDSCDEWYATPREFAASVLTEFAAFLGENLVVPAYVPQVKKNVIDRAALLRELMPALIKMLNRSMNAAVDRKEEEMNKGETFTGDAE